MLAECTKFSALGFSGCQKQQRLRARTGIRIGIRIGMLGGRVEWNVPRRCHPTSRPKPGETKPLKATKSGTKARKPRDESKGLAVMREIGTDLFHVNYFQLAR